MHTLSELATMVGGELFGEDVKITGISDLERQSPDTIVYADGPRQLKRVAGSEVAALLIGAETPYDGPKPCIRVENVKIAYAAISECFDPRTPYRKQIYPHVHVEPSAKIGEGVTILPFSCVMDEAEIGDGTVIHSNVFVGKGVRVGKGCTVKSGVRLEDFTAIGDRVIIHDNSVIGSDGFGYVRDGDRHVKISQIGRVVVGDDVEIGACVCIDRASIGETVVGSGVKIDNLVQIAHNVRIGEHSILVSQAGIAGSSSMGHHCILAGQAGVADHVTMGDGVAIMAQAGVEPGKIESGKTLLGSPARDFMEQKRVFASIHRLPETSKKVADLEKRISELEKRLT